MLCRRMRLTERHIQPPREPNDGPIIRPCTARKLTGSDGDSLYASGHHGRKPTEASKTPLMIVNLNIPNGARTLAPKSVKGPRKLPPFCVQHQQLVKAYGANQSLPGSSEESTSVCHTLNIPQIFIQGFEIQDKKVTALSPQKVQDCDLGPIAENEEDSFANILLDNISNISLDMINRHQQKLMGSMSMTNTPSNTPSRDCNTTGYGTLMNLDSYETDDLAPLPMEKQNDSLDELCQIPPGYRSLVYRTPSPSTRQIIRVNVTMGRDRRSDNSYSANH
ncbi:uncharacterized protein LOC129751454 [Uranotaenia lowii]|uniref:uncharacterized protein LOC129751454 n=1 Tax=Uranotaenia lowii TaxID=190385 RepID=UPI002479B1B2|nr:uncharacterized protein LOC129751454 [Uranotaenia lowii]XP_055602956.1 uncharacterized protein LOC129751454 [Uranotaenia lowii]XP_055602957.1 uncharacterized protein LOC129751454 [Uranotaenia lowii]XP_055602958.1 uncharacterized protein LOC129751454 [Uranotaenia lowii]